MHVNNWGCVSLTAGGKGRQAARWHLSWSSQGSEVKGVEDFPKMVGSGVFSGHLLDSSISSLCALWSRVRCSSRGSWSWPWGLCQPVPAGLGELQACVAAAVPLGSVGGRDGNFVKELEGPCPILGSILDSTSKLSPAGSMSRCSSQTLGPREARWLEPRVPALPHQNGQRTHWLPGP